MPILSVVSPLHPQASTCGYCSPPGQRSKEKSSHHAAELIPTQLSCEAYQAMIDRGWRRSGTYCYKPDLQRSCCPQYTIKLDALRFKSSKSQRKVVNRFNRWVLHGDGHEEQSQSSGNKKKQDTSFRLETAIHAAEHDLLADQPTAMHKFEVTLEPSCYTPEKFALYQIYQKEIHKEEKKKFPDDFRRFLVESPLHREAIPYTSPPAKHLPLEYGAYHQLYRLDGKLIAMAVIDILPNCVSSVYFMYNTEWERFSLGKLSALRELALTKEIREAGAPGMQYLYMGFYIHSCPKMRYKGEYFPSYLLDPEEYTWHPLGECKPLLDKYRYASFAHPEHCIEGIYTETTPKTNVPLEDLEDVQLLVSVRNGQAICQPVTKADEWDRSAVQEVIRITVQGLGLELAKDVLFYLAYEL